MKLLLHTCCGPCSLGCLAALREEGLSPSLYWYNPNIHPFTEYRARRDTLAGLARARGLNLLMDSGYGLRAFLQGLPKEAYTGEARCDFCYRLRLENTAETARANGFEAFSTTLLISPYQRHDRIRGIGEEAAARVGLPFFYRDFRPFFRDAQKEARTQGFYMQKYCGCIFSEEERYITANSPANTPGPCPLSGQ
jgi:predicted adenine nucleotide alpha hydrolase (AANH) superfamily ATPase